MTVPSVLAAAGITYLITGSKLLGAAVDAEGHALAPARPILESWWLSRSLASCSFCTGFWVALALAQALAHPLPVAAFALVGSGAGIVTGAALRQSTSGWSAVGAVGGVLLGAAVLLARAGGAAWAGAFADATGTAFAVMVLHDLRDALLRHRA